mgnify:CR=1 FL=1
MIAWSKDIRLADTTPLLGSNSGESLDCESSLVESEDPLSLESELLLVEEELSVLLDELADDEVSVLEEEVLLPEHYPF